MNRKSVFIQLRQQGETYEAIGKIFGISRQRVHATVTGYKSPKRLRGATKKGEGGLNNGKSEMFKLQ